MVKFAGINLTITADVVNEMLNTAVEDATPCNSNLAETIKVLEEVLRIRYNPETKLLDLSNLGDDILLKRNGFFELGSTTSKMFPALMSVADKKFTNNEQKRDWLHSVSLAGNNLKNVMPVNSLSFTFPDLKNLSLEGNLIDDIKGLDGWRSRFRSLEQLILLGNPVANAPGYKEEMLRRYPKLVMLDNNVVDRSQIRIQGTSTPNGSQPTNCPAVAIGPSGEPVLPLATKGNLLVDINGLAMSFLSTFFSQIDNNKDSLLEKFYTAVSKFSLSINTTAPRAEGVASWQHWDIYLPKSRNMKWLHDPGQLFERLARGPDEIRKLWNSLPPTQHNLGILELWSFDIFPVEISPGVNGILATVHSEYDEINTLMNSGNGGVIKRSFDRSFTLMTNTTGSVKVLSDMIVVRGYSGATAWKVDPTFVPPIANEQPVVHPEAHPVVAVEASVEEKQQRCQMLSEKTGLNLKFAEMCLADTNWDLARAWDAFMWAKDKLGPEAYAK